MSKKTLSNYKYTKRKMNIQQCMRSVGVLAAAFVFAGHAWAAGVINTITSGVQGGEILIKVELSEPLSQQPEGFVIQNPARISLDLPGVTNGMDRSQVTLSQGNLRSIQIAEAADRTRLILNLGNATPYTTEISGNVLLIRLSESRAVLSSAAINEQNYTTAPEVNSAQGLSAATSSGDLQGIEFRPSADGAGALIITLPTDQTEVNIRKQGGDIVLEVFQATLPPSLRKILDVSEFQTPMGMITPEQVGANVRLTVKPTAKVFYDQSSYQAQNQFVFELRPVKDSANELIPGSGYRGERLSLSFQDVEVRTLLQVIAQFTEFNIVTSDSVRGNLTLHLKDVPWDQALDIIMQARGLALDKTGNVLWIAPYSEIEEIRNRRLAAEQDNETMAPLRTQVFHFNYAQATDFTNALGAGGSSSEGSTSLLSTRGSVIVDSRTNKLIVTDVPSRLERISGVIAQIDIPVRQVMIEARIVEARDGWGRNLGVRLSGVGTASQRNYWARNPETGELSIQSYDRFAAGGTMPTEEDGSGGDDDSNRYSAKQDLYNFFNLPALPSSGDAGFFSFRFNSSAGRYLQLELQALETENYGRNIASPSLMTADSITAKVEQGVEIPYQEASASGATTVSFKPAILLLEVTPRITPDGNVDMRIEVRQDSQGELTLAGPSVDTTRINTQVTIENGGTVVIGGIFKEQELTVKSKIPFLGDIPLLGHFFRSTNSSHARTELLIFITPRIVEDGFNRASTNILPSLGGN